MSIIFVLHSKHAFSHALEGVASKSTTSFLLRECSQLIAYFIYKILQPLLHTQQLTYLGAFSFALCRYNQW